MIAQAIKIAQNRLPVDSIGDIKSLKLTKDFTIDGTLYPKNSVLIYLRKPQTYRDLAQNPKSNIKEVVGVSDAEKTEIFNALGISSKNQFAALVIPKPDQDINPKALQVVRGIAKIHLGLPYYKTFSSAQVVNQNVIVAGQKVPSGSIVLYYD